MENKVYENKEKLIKEINLEIQRLEKSKSAIEEDYQKLIKENQGFNKSKIERNK